MSPAMHHSRWRNGNSSNNASTANGRYYEDQVSLGKELVSPCGLPWDTQTNMVSVALGLASKQCQNPGQQLLGMINPKGLLPPPPPPAAPPPKTKLKSAASLFVPKVAMGSQAPLFMPKGTEPAAPPAPTSWQPAAARQGAGNSCSGKGDIMDVIQRTFGTQLWDLSMVDCQSFSGDWYTSVGITIPASCHVATSQDAGAIAASQQATQSLALQSLTESLQDLSPKVIVSPSEDPAYLSVSYCGADRDMLCWEFSHHGHCPRGSTCRWAHAMIETFLINFMLAPLMPMQTEASVEQKNSSTVTSLPLTNMFEQSDAQKVGTSLVDIPDDTPWPDYIQGHGFSIPNADKEERVKTEAKEASKPILRSKIRSGRSWADIQEDSDDDEPFLPNWS